MGAADLGVKVGNGDHGPGYCFQICDGLGGGEGRRVSLGRSTRTSEDRQGLQHSSSRRKNFGYRGAPGWEKESRTGWAGLVILLVSCNVVMLGFQEGSECPRGMTGPLLPSSLSRAPCPTAPRSLSLSLSLSISLSLPGVSGHFAPSRRRNLSGSRGQSTQPKPGGSSPLPPEPLVAATLARAPGFILLAKMEELRPLSCGIRSCW